MAVIKAFKSIRPEKELAGKVAALPYDVYNTEEAIEAVKGNPYSFLHIDKSEIDLPSDTDPYSEEVYLKARSTMDSFTEKGIFIQDDTPKLYIYRLIMDGRIQTGLVCCSAIDDYINGTIKRHELTREDKEKDRINHVDYCDANTGPIFLTYESKKNINAIVESWTGKQTPEYDFVTEDGITHQVWIIDNPETIETLVDEFDKIPSTYIADGHHRTASAVKVGLKRRESNPNHTGNEEYNFFLSVLFPHDQLYIMDYNRVVKDLNSMTTDEFISKLEEVMDVESSGSQPFKPSQKGEIGLYLDDTWYRLTVKENTVDYKDPVASLDVSILQESVLKPLLGIGDIRTDKRIDFVGGIRGLKELERRCKIDMKLAFAMYPTSIKELMAISDAGLLMPPKSTWFEPKLRSGIFIHQLT
ncbi:DUF1015 domain-containing protein [Alkalibacter saccharofermentans]|uniref:Uncharacterized conserved protein, DUF1015 family n=1 Tax=Alkalibacter saccharofermentans DSM 14828 TaxID=1120975 RepID=A0A1M4WVL1_9FIRM|nr:DUF1015 family protein [Alkalibacter saccharofermentans]SHE85266.1 Uncharacterized conserved protein, DUF1015 family [Alkalibacter saccharofermentans DSM 14828]